MCFLGLSVFLLCWVLGCRPGADGKDSGDAGLVLNRTSIHCQSDNTGPGQETVCDPRPNPTGRLPQRQYGGL